MKKVWKTVTGALLAAARSRARQVMRKQAQLGQPWQEVYRGNAGGWN